MSRVEAATIALYESADLRDNLVDDDADNLLKWAESEIARLDASSPDDEAFAAGVEALQRVIKGMNRFVGKWAQLTPDERTAALDKIAGASADIGRPVSVESAPKLADTVPAGDQTLRGDPMLFDSTAFARPVSDSEVLDLLMLWVNGSGDTGTGQPDPSAVSSESVSSQVPLQGELSAEDEEIDL